MDSRAAVNVHDALLPYREEYGAERLFCKRFNKRSGKIFRHAARHVLRCRKIYSRDAVERMGRMPCIPFSMKNKTEENWQCWIMTRSLSAEAPQDLPPVCI